MKLLTTKEKQCGSAFLRNNINNNVWEYNCKKCKNSHYILDKDEAGACHFCGYEETKPLTTLEKLDYLKPLFDISEKELLEACYDVNKRVIEAIKRDKSEHKSLTRLQGRILNEIKLLEK